MDWSSARFRFALGLFLGALVGVSLQFVFYQSAIQQLRWQEYQRRSIITLQSLAEVMANAGGGGEEERNAVMQIAKQYRDVRQIRVVKGVRLEASTAPEDTGEKAAPRRLAREEKPLY